MKIFDPYIRSRTQSDDDLKNLHYFGTDEVLTTAHGIEPFETAQKLIESFEQLSDQECDRLRRCNLKPHVALGVLPDARPRRSHYEVWDALPQLLKRSDVVALGEVGVWEDGDEHWQLFERQVRIAKQVGPIPIVVTPPRELKITLTYKMMNRLEKWGYPPSLVVMNGLNKKLLKTVIETGFCAGYSVGSTTNEPREAGRDIIEILELVDGSDQILLTTALRQSGGDVLGVAKTIEVLDEQGVKALDIEQMVYDNAARLFGDK